MVSNDIALECDNETGHRKVIYVFSNVDNVAYQIWDLWGVEIHFDGVYRDNLQEFWQPIHFTVIKPIHFTVC